MPRLIITTGEPAPRREDVKGGIIIGFAEAAAFCAYRDATNDARKAQQEASEAGKSADEARDRARDAWDRVHHARLAMDALIRGDAK